MPLRAAVIGCGMIGSRFADDPRVRGVYTHAGAYAACDEVRLAAVCDSDPERATACARRWGLQTGYTDLERLLAEVQPEIVSVCTPDETHLPILRTVLSADGVKAVLAEKPLAPRSEEAADIVHAARRRRVVLAVNYVRRYAPGHQRVKAALSRGDFGSIQAVGGLYSGGLLHNGTHWIDLVRWLVGEITSVQAFGLDLQMQFAGGASALLHCAGDAFALFEVDIVGSAGRVRIVDSGHRIETYAVGDSPHYSGYRTLVPAGVEDGGLGDALPNAVKDVVECIRSGRAPICGGEDGLAAIRVVEAAHASRQTGQPVRL